MCEDWGVEKNCQHSKWNGIKCVFASSVQLLDKKWQTKIVYRWDFNLFPQHFGKTFHVDVSSISIAHSHFASKYVQNTHDRTWESEVECFEIIFKQNVNESLQWIKNWLNFSRNWEWIRREKNTEKLPKIKCNFYSYFQVQCVEHGNFSIVPI